MHSGPEASEGARAGVLEPLRAQPREVALLTDVDGTLAPIVERPEEAAVPARAAQLLRELAGRYRFVGCVSGRRAEEARRLVGVEEIAYSGNHGLELLLPGDSSPRLEPSLRETGGGVAGFAARLGAERLAAAGLRLEDKGPIQALHWRGAPDESAAEALAGEVAEQAAAEGLTPHWGRKVLELRPPGGIGKDTAVAALLAPAGASVAAYAGDDRTDLDAFRRLREMEQRGELRRAICVAVTSSEGPGELAEAGDLRVDGPDGWLAVLETLAAAEE